MTRRLMRRSGLFGSKGTIVHHPRIEEFESELFTSEFEEPNAETKKTNEFPSPRCRRPSSYSATHTFSISTSCSSNLRFPYSNQPLPLLPDLLRQSRLVAIPRRRDARDEMIVGFRSEFRLSGVSGACWRTETICDNCIWAWPESRPLHGVGVRCNDTFIGRCIERCAAGGVLLDSCACTCRSKFGEAAWVHNVSDIHLFRYERAMSEL